MLLSVPSSWKQKPALVRCAVSNIASATVRNRPWLLPLPSPPAEFVPLAPRQLSGTLWHFKLDYRGNVQRGAPPAADGRRERAAVRQNPKGPPQTPQTACEVLIARAARLRTTILPGPLHTPQAPGDHTRCGGSSRGRCPALPPFFPPMSAAHIY